MPHTYTIKQFVISRYLVLSFAFIAIWVGLGIWLLSLSFQTTEAQEWIGISAFAIGFVALLFTSRWLATLACTYQLTESGITQQWQKTLLAPPDQQRFWSDLNTYKVDEDANGTLIKLTFKQSKPLTIAHSDSIADDFEVFMGTLLNAIDDYNAKGIAGAPPLIARSPSFFETTTAQVFAGVLAIMLIALTYLQYLSDIGFDNLNWWKTIWLYFLGIPFIVRVFGKIPERYK